MGEIKEFRCECGYHTSLREGAGMLAVVEDVMEKVFPKGYKTYLEKKQSGEVQSAMLSHDLFLCEKCKRLLTAPVIRCYNENDREVFLIPSKICDKCGSEIIALVSDEIKCPVCNKKLEISRVGLWD